MMRTGTLLLLLAVAALALMLPAVRAQEAEVEAEAEAGVGRKTGLFQRIARVLDTGAAEDDDGLPIDWEASKDEGAPVDPNQVAYTELDDAWGFDLGLKMIQQTLDGDATGAFLAMFDATKDLKDAWMVPKVFKFMMKEMPLFQAIKPMAAIAKKDTITAQDGLDALDFFKDFLKKSMGVMQTMQDPGKLAAKMYEYQQSTDPKLVSLINNAGEGKDPNFLALNKYIMQKELGDLVDLEMLGFNGVEPPFLEEYRNKVKQHAPFFFDNIVTDPVMRKYMANPFLAVQEAQEIAKSYAAAPL